MRTKAEFRAIRETVGMTQAHLASMLGVEVRSVKRWENPDAPQVPPQDAWDLVDEAAASQRAALDAMIDQAAKAAAEHGELSAVALPYWASQSAYDAGHYSGADGADWRMVNATSRLAAVELGRRGIAVRWGDGSYVKSAIGG